MIIEGHLWSDRKSVYLWNIRNRRLYLSIDLLLLEVIPRFIVRSLQMEEEIRADRSAMMLK